MRTSAELLAELKLLHPKSIDLSLGRIERLLARLGHPERRLAPVVHIAGTNGKGSVSAFMRAMIEAAGLRVHVYTSPHLVRFAERIVLAEGPGRSAPIADASLSEMLERVRAANAGDPITFFEITTAAALLAFAETPADAVVLEVGLGGRLDATNVVARPAVTVITPVSMDHMERLGDTLGRIAGEKAGILKRAVPAVIAAQEPAAAAVIESVAAKVGAPLTAWGRDFDAYEQAGRLVFQTASRLLDLPMPGLIGRHQIVNAGTAVAAALALADRVPLAIGDIERGLTAVSWPARMQRLRRGPLPDLLDSAAELWLDGGHNPAGGGALAQTLADLDERAPKPLFLVVGMMGHKDARGFLSHFAGLASRAIAVAVAATHEPARQAGELAAIARRAGLAADTAGSVAEALERLAREHPGAKRVVICGSLYLAGQVLAQQEGVAVEPN